MKKLNQNLAKITNLLSDGEFHDGTSIGNSLGITRTAVWKMIKRLEGHDIPIHSIKGKGYSLDEPLILLNPKDIKKNTNTPVDITVFEQIDSTNQYLKSLPLQQDIRVCLAETQSSGKGRLQRQWHSPFGKNIYFSLLYPFKKDISELSGLSLATALSTCKTLESQAGIQTPIQVKWPNDIIANKKKLAGSLIEIQAESHAFCCAIIGIGININMVADPYHSISQPWTSLRALTNTYHDRNAICADLINQLLIDLNTFEQQGLSAFLTEWKKRDYLYGQNIALQSGNHRIDGKVTGINTQGHLLLKLDSGETKAFSSGDTTLKLSKRTPDME